MGYRPKYDKILNIDSPPLKFIPIEHAEWHNQILLNLFCSQHMYKKKSSLNYLFGILGYVAFIIALIYELQKRVFIDSYAMSVAMYPT